jgi:hypothetical protein
MRQLTRRTVLAGAGAVAATSLASFSAVRTAAGDPPDFTLCPTQLVKEFLAFAQGPQHTLSPEDRKLIVEEAEKLLATFYPHLPSKRAKYGVDPLERLRILKQRVSQVSPNAQFVTDLPFHAEMTDIFTSLRDGHAVYTLPDPYRDRHAWLPFKTESCIEGGRRKYFVSRVVDGYVHPTFRKGVEVLSWNGVPVEQAAERAGPPRGTPAARHALGLTRLTYRWLFLNPPPQEDAVLVHYRAGGREREISIPWNLSQQPLDRCSQDAEVCTEIEQLKKFRQFLFAPYTPCTAFGTPERITTPDGVFGYIRIFSFDKDLLGDTKFIQTFRQHVTGLARGTRGLIIDVRDNGGGSIRAGERILQSFTRMRPIQPSKFYFVATETTKKFCNLGESVKELGPDSDGLQPYVASIEQALLNHEPFSIARPYANAALCNSDPQPIFSGPVVIVTNALTYSSAEMFAAGFQDHGGMILGVDETTGGGGAHARTNDQLSDFFGNSTPFKTLPKNAGFSIAFRRGVRVGLGAGQEIEDSGVHCNRSYSMTRHDLLNSNQDLKRAAARLLAQMS